MSKSLEFLNFHVVIRILSYVITVAIAVGLTMLLLYIAGFNPWHVWGEIIRGSFGSVNALRATFNRTAPILLCGLGTAVAFRSGMWNIGSEGQLLMGGLGAALAGLYLSLPKVLHIIAAGAGSFALGGAWALIVGYLKVKRNANEIILTLLMNFIAFWFISYLARFPMRDWSAYNPRSAVMAETARLPEIVPGFSHIGIIIGLCIAVVVWFILNKTVLGYRIRAVGECRETAYYGGIPTNKIILLSMLISGGIAGLAGMTEVLGIQFRLYEGISSNYGYLGIGVALLGKLNIAGVVVASVLIGALWTGGRFVQGTIEVPAAIIMVFVALVIACFLLEQPIEKNIRKLIGKKP